MLINKQIIEKLNPCEIRFDNFLLHYPNFSGNLRDFVSLDNITYSDKIWVVTRLFNKKQKVRFALMCASSALSIFENEYPNNKTPRRTLEAVQNWLNNPCKETESKLNLLEQFASLTAMSTTLDSAWSVVWSVVWTLWTAKLTWTKSSWSIISALMSAINCAELASESDQENVNLIFLVEAE